VTTEEQIALRYTTLKPIINERVRRLLAAVEASVLGYGGIEKVSVATGLSRNTIVRGIAELKNIGESTFKDAAIVRKKGGGRKKAIDLDPTIREDLDKLVNPSTRGDPMSPLRWTCKSLRNLEEALQKLGHRITLQRHLCDITSVYIADFSLAMR